MNTQVTGEIRPESKPFQIQDTTKVSLGTILAAQAIERGIDPMIMEVDLLIKRIKQGGHSGQFLHDAYRSAYRNLPFDHGLGELTKLDAEAFRIFHEILHIRHVSGWSDQRLYEIEKQVISAYQYNGDVS